MITSRGEPPLLINHLFANANFPASTKTNIIANRIAYDKTCKSVIANPYNVGIVMLARSKNPFLGSSLFR